MAKKLFWIGPLEVFLIKFYFWVSLMQACLGRSSCSIDVSKTVISDEPLYQLVVQASCWFVEFFRFLSKCREEEEEEEDTRKEKE